MIRISRLIAVVFKRRNPLHKRKESSLVKQTTRKLRLDSLEARNLLSCVGFADPGVLAESPESSLVECRATEAIATTRDVNVIYFELDDAPFCGPLPKEAHEALMRRIQSGNAVSAEESEAIIETHSHDNVLEPVERVKPVAASQAAIKQFNFDAETLDVGGTTYSSGSGGSGSDSGGSGSSGGSTSGGSTSSGGTHEYCSHNPWLCGGLGSSSSGGASGGNSKPGFYLITNDYDEIELQLWAGDADETSERNENLQLVASNLPIKDQSLTKDGNTYVFTVKLDVSSYGTINGSFKVVDCHGRESASVDVCVRPVKITGFEIQEKAPGAETYASLEDYHVVWQENSNRVCFNVLGDIDGDDPDDYAAFTNLFTYQVKGQAWTWDSTTNDYVRSNTWNSFNGLNGGLGVYNLEIDLYANNQKFKSLPDNARYCFNAVSSVAWDSTLNSGVAASSCVEYISDGNNGYKVFVERPLDTETGVIGTWKNVAPASVSLAIPIPSELEATVYVAWFDPDNPIGTRGTISSRKAGWRDNNGAVLEMSSGVLRFSSTNPQKQYLTLTIDIANPGDNYLLAVHPNGGVVQIADIKENNDVVVSREATSSGGTASGGGTGSFCEEVALTTSPILTIWRTLWIERDRMILSQNTGNAQLADSVPIDGFVKTELSRACVDLREYVCNDNVTVAGIGSFEQEMSFDPYITSRNLILPTANFWTITAIGGFSSEDYYGFFYGNNICVFSDSVKKDINDLNSIQGSTLSALNAVRRTTLHEIGHAFGLADVDVSGLENIPDEYVGIMVTGSGWFHRLLPDNLSFTVDNLHLIQERHEPVTNFSIIE